MKTPSCSDLSTSFTYFTASVTTETPLWLDEFLISSYQIVAFPYSSRWSVRRPQTWEMDTMLTLVTLLGCLSVASADIDTRLDGVWHYSRCERDGKSASQEEFARFHDYARFFLIADGGRFQFNGAIGGSNLGGPPPAWTRYPGTIRVNTAKTPSEVDFIGPDPDSRAMRGVYRIDGDTLRLRLGRPGATRPGAFGGGVLEEVWTREPGAVALLGSDGKFVVVRPDVIASTKKGLFPTMPPIHPALYIEAGRRLYREDDFRRAALCLEEARNHRQMLTGIEQKRLDEFRAMMAREDAEH
jgi:uncharacterized protein (TIGR03067 family)